MSQNARLARTLDALVSAAVDLRKALAETSGDGLATIAKPEAGMDVPMNSPTAPLMLTQAETAALIRIHPRTLQRLRASGEGPKPIRIGRSIRYRRKDVERWLEGKRS